MINLPSEHPASGLFGFFSGVLVAQNPPRQSWRFAPADSKSRFSSCRGDSRARAPSARARTRATPGPRCLTVLARWSRGPGGALLKTPQRPVAQQVLLLTLGANKWCLKVNSDYKRGFALCLPSLSSSSHKVDGKQKHKRPLYGRLHFFAAATSQQLSRDSFSTVAYLLV